MLRRQGTLYCLMSSTISVAPHVSLQTGPTKTETPESLTTVFQTSIATSKSSASATVNLTTPPYLVISTKLRDRSLSQVFSPEPGSFQSMTSCVPIKKTSAGTSNVPLVKTSVVHGSSGPSNSRCRRLMSSL